MKTISLSYRIMLIAAMEGIFLLITGIANAFMDTSALDNLVFHSMWFHVALFVICWFLAPVLAGWLRSPKRGES